MVSLPLFSPETYMFRQAIYDLAPVTFPSAIPCDKYHELGILSDHSWSLSHR